MPATVICPSRAEEKLLRKQGFILIAGLDEAGRGCLAGPVVAGAVIMPPRLKGDWVEMVRDSKVLSPAKREYLYCHIVSMAVTFGVGAVDNEQIDSMGIAPATRLAMKQAVEDLTCQPDFLLVDYLKLPDIPLPQKGIVDGDALCFSIACASIVAKVSRDRLMSKLDMEYPGYYLAKHKGYGTALHVECICQKGISPIHRRTFAPLKGMIDGL
ncbi:MULTISPECIES: ribonuclease HII [Dehalococcoides]|jgi:ribonuclease HII|uniref:Ribonuclease HII n=2 Tax=Dehalococcoides mccartyi TaxID=61435 RepID=RNH2_DEHMB|nr:MULTISPECIES: ribonuclease HII [Dehalococcoides]A5FR86.1 RecName: Full=Ribonuclease HII; Short=RNase HII [Dehalococcoides mccartyi BAV1]AGG06367.1 ribonuclease HII [Dehalococcoides mccartyi DCMB5]AGG07798.1 ribonuclease HII [Dehalococcoides mccartyi BTF08]AII60827.1 ribonuclease HII [Dehalococcoides mccartyi CG5]AMU86500.1 ribonuclease HII [Dehalococcoides mccartyi]AOV99325.1 ribonuclease [Dehalococcoides mccartyi]